MATGEGKCSKIRRIVRLRQMIKQWRNKARTTANRTKSDVPAGHVAVCVGSNFRRYVVRASYLNHPLFVALLAQAEDEYGFGNYGPLSIPCDEKKFEEVVWLISRSEIGNFSPLAGEAYLEETRCSGRFLVDSRPLLRVLQHEMIW